MSFESCHLLPPPVVSRRPEVVGGDDVGGYTEGGPTSDLFRARGATFVGRYGRTGGPRQQPCWELRSHRQIKAISIDGQVNYRPDMHDLATRLLAGALTSA